MGFYLNKLRIAFWTLFYYSAGRLQFSELGSGCRFSGWIDVPQLGGTLSVGRGVFFCRNVELTVARDARLTIGDNVFVGRGVVISAHDAVYIGRDTLIAEYVSIHDNDHVFKEIGKPIHEQGFVAEPCSIGDGCWIGAGSKILKGAGIGNNSVLGAGSVLTKQLISNVVAVGVPAKVIKSRSPEK